LAVVVNSNFSRDLDLVSLTEAKPVALAPYLSFREVGQLLLAKIRSGVQRRIR